MTIRSFLLPLLTLLFCLMLPPLVRADSLTLLDGLKLVTEESRVVRIRQQEERMSQADTAVARSRLLPSVDLSYGQTALEHQPGVIVEGLSAPTAERSFYTYQVAIRQIVYDFGGTSSLYNAAKLTEETKRLGTKRARNSVALDFSLLYFDVLQSEKLTAVAQKEIESLEGHLRVARELLQNGLITKNDVLQAEVKLADARQKLLFSENARKIGAAALNTLLARPISTPLEVVELARRQSPAVEDEQAAIVAERERPEFRELDTALKVLGYEETARQSEYLPQIWAQAQYDYTKNKYVTFEGNAGVSLLMRVNLSNGGKTKAEIQKLEMAQSRLRMERQRLTDDIRLELQRHYLELMNARERVVIAERVISQAEENLRITRVKYGEGVGIATDVTDAIALRALSETNYYRALYDWYRSEARYLSTMGKNLEEEFRG
jgi:outer membrane protein